MAYITDGDEPSLNTALQKKQMPDHCKRQNGVMAIMFDLRARGLASRAFGL